MNADAAYVIVRASLAGAKAAETLRQEGFDGPLVLIGEESERPYERPPLSKDYLLGKADRETMYVHPRPWYAEHGVDLRLGVRVSGLDPAEHQVRLAAGSCVGYAKLLLATGSTPRRLPAPGADAGGVLYLRRVADSDQIKEAFAAASRVAVIGAGWIGLETAATARAAGVQVTILGHPTAEASGVSSSGRTLMAFAMADLARAVSSLRAPGNRDGGEQDQQPVEVAHGRYGHWPSWRRVSDAPGPGRPGRQWLAGLATSRTGVHTCITS
jgi:hypothetical protein